MNEVRFCKACNISSEEKILSWCSKVNGFLCPKHKTQLYKHGKILDSIKETTHDKNKYNIIDNYAEIILVNNKQNIVGKAIIDIDNIEKCKKYKWHINKDGYVYYDINRKNKKERCFLHRFILNYSGNLDIDHINRNKLDNRKENLRIVECCINCANNNAKGVTKTKSNKWNARFRRYGISYNVGTFNTKEEAIIKREEKIIEIENKEKDLLLKKHNRDFEHHIGIIPTTSGKWYAYICNKNKTLTIGTFKTKEEAIIERKKYITEILQK